MKTELKYKTFTELLDEVSVDFTMYNTENLLDPAQLIKVAQKVTYDLGLRIHGTKEKVLEISHTKTRLPDDFYVLNYAYLCGKYRTVEPRMMGRHTENIILGRSDCPKCGCKDLTCNCESTYTVECQWGEKIGVQVIEKRVNDVRVYDQFEKIRISNTTGQVDALDNGNMPSGYIKNGYMYTNVSEAQLFISYQGALEDEEGNLLVLDHPMINEYYEYAIKQRLLENLYMNGEDVIQKLQLIEQRLKAARNYALTIVNMPDYAELKQVWEMNRKAQYAKFYSMFEGYEFTQWIAPIK